MLVTHRIEVKRLTADLVDSLSALGAFAQQRVTEEVPPMSIQVPHPQRPGEEVTLFHAGAGSYSPIDPNIILSGVEEVEGQY
jgi:hypothetical protein